MDAHIFAFRSKGRLTRPTSTIIPKMTMNLLMTSQAGIRTFSAVCNNHLVRKRCLRALWDALGCHVMPKNNFELLCFLFQLLWSVSWGGGGHCVSHDLCLANPAAKRQICLWMIDWLKYAWRSTGWAIVLCVGLCESKRQHSWTFTFEIKCYVIQTSYLVLEPNQQNSN